MTYKEAKRIIIRHRLLFASMPDEVLEALDFFMERDQVLDSVRKEVEDLYTNDYSSYACAIENVLKIIDKYKTESEG